MFKHYNCCLGKKMLELLWRGHEKKVHTIPNVFSYFFVPSCDSMKAHKGICEMLDSGYCLHYMLIYSTSLDELQDVFLLAIRLQKKL